MSEDCSIIVDQIPGYIRGISIEDKGRFLSHIAGCGACRRELTDNARLMKQISLYFDSAPVPDVKESLSALRQVLGLQGEHSGEAANKSSSFASATGAEWTVAVSTIKTFSNMVSGAINFATPEYWVTLSRKAVEAF